MITLSGLGHVVACPGSAALPRAKREGTRGTPLGRAIHALCEHRAEAGGVRDGSDYDVARVAYVHGLYGDDAGRLAFLAEHLRLPIPAGALAEVPLGYWPDGSVRRAQGGAGEYIDEGQWLSGTIDIMWAEPHPIWLEEQHGEGRAISAPNSTAWVVDWKTGDDEHVPPIDRNWQLRGAAVMAARWTGARRVIPAICYINAAECGEAVRAGRVYEGRWEVGKPLDAAALDAIEVELRAALARARGECDAARGQEHGQEADASTVHLPMKVSDGTSSRRAVSGARLILGPHCEHCPARGACPALAAEAMTLARAYEQTLVEGAADGLALTPEQASRLMGLVPAIRRACDAVEAAAQAHVRATGKPLALANGQEYGPAIETTEGFVTRPTYEALAEIVGDERADEAFLATADRIKAALRGDAKRLPRGAWDEFVEKVKARGGIVSGAREVWRKRWPAKP